MNEAVMALGPYASKRISEAAKRDASIVNLSIGEPFFGPPEPLLQQIETEDLSLATFLQCAKSYETTQGSLALRRAISRWYLRRYGLVVNPDTEILVTHGGVEALTLALLACTAPGDRVALTDPSYMLYQRALLTLGRQPDVFLRPPAYDEYAALLGQNDAFVQGLRNAAALIINSPENPTGYVLSENDWRQVMAHADEGKTWVIHDEVYDSMTFGRAHFSARRFDRSGKRHILLNSMSKKFGVPGLRIGWMVACPEVIEAAGKVHDYLVLAVNAQYERIATRILDYPQIDAWLSQQTELIAKRSQAVQSTLTAARGFAWTRKPMGGMFAFPQVAALANSLPASARAASAGEDVATFLLQQARVATVPGAVYGQQGQDHLRMVLSAPPAAFDAALQRLSALPTLQLAARTSYA